MGHEPLGMAVNPTQRLLYVNFPFSSFPTAPTASALATYSYSSTGALSLASVVSNPITAACWALVSPNGQFLYTSNAGSGNISVLSLANPSTPAFVQAVNVTGTGTAGSLTGNPWQLAMNPAGTFLYVVTPRDLGNTPAGQGNTLHSFAVNANGTLTETANSPIVLPVPGSPTTNPQGVIAI